MWQTMGDAFLKFDEVCSALQICGGPWLQVLQRRKINKAGINEELLDGVQGLCRLLLAQMSLQLTQCTISASLGIVQASRDSESGRREISMVEVNEESLDGELPFLLRGSIGEDDGGAGANRRLSAADGLPTHEAPPRKSAGFLQRK